jgi:hypothetical protein
MKSKIGIALVVAVVTVLAIVPVANAKGEKDQGSGIIDDFMVANADGLQLRRVGSIVRLRLDSGYKAAHFNVIIRGGTFTGIRSLDSWGVNGLEDPNIGGTAWLPVSSAGDGAFGGCSDDAQLNFGASHISKAQLYTCGADDVFDLRYELNQRFGGKPAIKIVFTEDDNVEREVNINGDGTYASGEWIPLTDK